MRRPAKPGAKVELKGNFPKYDWRTEGWIKEYWDQYNLNDGIAPTLVETLILAHRIYEREDSHEAMKRLGRFLIRAQMPEPKPAWAQQYNYEMQPVWARKFEPPAIASRESEGVIEALMAIAVYSRDKEFLKPIPAALDYLERLRLPDGLMARFYELETNRPLYMKREGTVYRLTFDDSDLPDHYGWKSKPKAGKLWEVFEVVRKTGRLPEKKEPDPNKRLAKVLAELDDQGRWVTRHDGGKLLGQAKFRDGEEFLDSGVFCKNLNLLSEALGRK